MAKNRNPDGACNLIQKTESDPLVLVTNSQNEDDKSSAFLGGLGCQESIGAQ